MTPPHLLPADGSAAGTDRDRDVKVTVDVKPVGATIKAEADASLRDAKVKKGLSD